MLHLVLKSFDSDSIQLTFIICPKIVYYEKRSTKIKKVYCGIQTTGHILYRLWLLTSLSFTHSCQ